MTIGSSSDDVSDHRRDNGVENDNTSIIVDGMKKADEDLAKMTAHWC
jgi:hypothetical protein